MLKKLVLLLSISFILVSCWKDETDTSTNVVWLSTFESSNFLIDIPSSWEIISDKEKILPKPSSWEISLAATSLELTDWFAHNILVLSSWLKEQTTSSDFSILNNIWAEKDYLNYRKLDSKEFTFNDWEKSMIYEFEAKYNLDTPKLRFLQTAHICNKMEAHFFTVALSSQLRDTSKYETFLKTFKCK